MDSLFSVHTDLWIFIPAAAVPSPITTTTKQDGESLSPKTDRAEHSARMLVKTQMPAIMQHIQIA